MGQCFTKLELTEVFSNMPYSRKVWRVEKFGEFGELSAIHQTKISKLVVTINKLLAGLFIRKKFSAIRLKRVNSPNFLPAKLSCYMVVLLYLYILYFLLLQN